MLGLSQSRNEVKYECRNTSALPICLTNMDGDDVPFFNLPSIVFSRDTYRGADKSLARPGRKQATATEDFDVHISYL